MKSRIIRRSKLVVPCLCDIQTGPLGLNAHSLVEIAYLNNQDGNNAIGHPLVMSRLAGREIADASLGLPHAARADEARGNVRALASD